MVPRLLGLFVGFTPLFFTSVPLLAQEGSREIRGSFLCLSMAEITEQNVPRNLEEIVLKLRKSRPLEIEETYVLFDSGFVFAEHNWKIQVNHNGLLVATRSTTAAEDLGCLERKKNQPLLACNPSFSEYDQRVITPESHDVFWETLIFSESSKELWLVSSSSLERVPITEIFSCVDG